MSLCANIVCGARGTIVAVLKRTQFLSRPVSHAKLNIFPHQIQPSARNLHFERKPHWSLYNMACPGNKMRFDLNPSDISSKCEELIIKSRAVYEAVGSLKPDEVTFVNVVKVCRLPFCHILSRSILNFNRIS